MQTFDLSHPTRSPPGQLRRTRQALGHSDLSTTLGIYGHRDADDVKATMDALERWRAEQEAEA